ncbi:MAG: hypothetical protein QM709_11215 [Spongiibacteraceae bacterium]
MTVFAYATIAALVFFLGCLAFEELEGAYSGVVSKKQTHKS